MGYLGYIIDFLQKAFFAITDTFPFGIFANIFGVNNAFNSDFAFYFFYILGLFFGAGFIFVFIKALNIVITTRVAAGGSDKEIRLFDLFSRFLLGRDTLPLFIYKFGFAFSKNTWTFFGFIALGILFYLPATINGQNISTLGGYRDLYNLKFQETQRAIFSSILGDKESVLSNTETLMKASSIFDASAFVIRNDCIQISNVDESAKCLRDNQLYFDLFKKTLDNIDELVLKSKQNGISYAEAINIIESDKRTYEDRFSNINLAINAVSSKTITQSQLDDVISDKPFVVNDNIQNSTSTGTSNSVNSVDLTNAGKRLANKAISIKKELISKNSAYLTFKGPSSTPYSSFEDLSKKRQEMSNNYDNAQNATTNEILSKIDILKGIYKTQEALGANWIDAYLNTIKYNEYSSGSTITTFNFMDKLAYTANSMYGILIILLAFLMSGWKSILLLFDFYYRNFISKTKDSFIQKLLIRSGDSNNADEKSFDLYNGENWQGDKLDDTRSRLMNDDDKDASYFSKKLELQESIGDEVVVMNNMRGTYYILLVIEIFTKTGLVLWLIFG